MTTAEATEAASAIARISNGVFFSEPEALPRGRHVLSRDEIAAAHRERLMIAATELLAAGGYRSFGIREICAQAGVSRSAFYACFNDKDECIFAAYDRFIEVLITELATRSEGPSTWEELLTSFISAYLDTLEKDFVVARAFQVEMDTLGRPARDRRHAALSGIAAFLRSRRVARRPDGVDDMPLSAYVGVVYAVRQLACDELDRSDRPDLHGLVPELQSWVVRMFEDPEASV